MKKHFMRLAEQGETLVSENVAQALRDDLEARVDNGEAVVIDFSGVAATTQFVSTLLAGLPQFLAERGDGVQDVGIRGMSDPIRRKVTLALEDPCALSSQPELV